MRSRRTRPEAIRACNSNDYNSPPQRKRPDPPNDTFENMFDVVSASFGKLPRVWFMSHDGIDCPFFNDQIETIGRIERRLQRADVGTNPTHLPMLCRVRL